MLAPSERRLPRPVTWQIIVMQIAAPGCDKV
jgi:hypothetical protein